MFNVSMFEVDENFSVSVTGGIGAVGSQVIYSILESGGDVICFDLPKDPPNLDRFHNLASKTSTQFSYYSLNVISAPDVSSVVDLAVSKLRFTLRGVVTAAGISGEVDAVDYTPEDFRRFLDVDVMGYVETGSWGCVVLIASMSGSVANKGVHTSAYNSSKAAVQQLARSLASEWGANSSNDPPVRVNSISPGYIYTPLTEVALANPEVKKTWLEGNMLGRISHPEEYRAPILFLLGDGSCFMTGADLRVDGGHTAW
ncbi:putative short-chain dehydrogenase [Rhexocercosporidium sp. MPI-PUGE-AT-0058]|nr:putative short-chain dehydrogenase [Rhexocercosporidium sp. MPI-PUGE-AT-0058]